jgi:type I restriction enzyme, S subunit
VKIGELIKESRIPATNPNPDKRIRVKLHVLGVEKRPYENEIAGATKQFERKAGQFIYGKQNFHKGAFGIIPKELDGYETSADIPSFDLRKNCLAEWVYYFFKIGNKYLELEKYARGVGSKRIHPDQISDIEIPLPEISEQRRLINYFKEIEKNYFTISAELFTQLDYVKQLRQTFLKEAMQGKLVPQNPKDEPASELLKKIKAEKLRLLNGKKEKPLPEIKPEEVPYEIPKNWVWCRLGEICSKIGSGSTPRGSNYAKTGIPFIRSQDVYNNKLIFEDITYITKEVHDGMNGTKVYAKDVLLNITGGSMGRCALVPDDFKEGNVSQHVCIIRTINIDNNFLHYVVLSPYFQRFVFNSTTGAGREGLPKYNLERFPFPLPPLSEQHRIVKKLDELMKLCDELEHSIKQSKEQSENLLQTVLREALEPNKKGI